MASAASLGQLSWDSYLEPSRVSPQAREVAGRENTMMMTRKREKMLMPVCARVSPSKFRTLEVWCDNSFRRRSEVVAMVLERVLDIVEQQENIEQPVEEFIRRLRADQGE